MAYGITLEDFHFLNSQVDNQCSSLWLDTSYCVKAVGNIATYSGYSISTVSRAFQRPVTATPTSTFTLIALPPLSAKAPGIVNGCDVYEIEFTSGNFDLAEMSSVKTGPGGMTSIWRIFCAGTLAIRGITA